MLASCARKRKIVATRGKQRLRGLLQDAGVKARLSQDLDGRGWELRVGPVPGEDVARLIDQFVW